MYIEPDIENTHMFAFSDNLHPILNKHFTSYTEIDHTERDDFEVATHPNIIVDKNDIVYITLASTLYRAITAMNSTSTSEHRMVVLPLSLLIFKAVAFGILIILNLCLNSLTLVVLRRMRELKPATRVFLTSMTIADLISLVYHIPTFISTALNRWPLGDIACKVFSLTSVMIHLLYYINLPMVNIERYIAVAWPLRYSSLVTVKRSRMAVAGVWSFALLLAIVAYSLVPYHQYIEVFHICMPSFQPSTHTYNTRTSSLITWEIIAMLIVSLTPVALSLVLFLRLYIISRAHVARIAAQNRNIAGSNNTLAMERKTFITLFIMTICITVCMVPNVVASVYFSSHPGHISYWFVCFAQLLYLANTIVNVIVYYWRTVAFRETAIKVILFHQQIMQVNMII